MGVFEGDDTPAQVLAKVQQCTTGDDAARILSEGSAAIGKLRLVGVYDDRQDGYFMLRTRIPGGRLTWQQAQTIGLVAEQFARRPPDEVDAPERFLEITTRQDIQTHWMRLEDLHRIWRLYEDVGLTSLQACGDTTRNVTGCPVAGVNKDEVMDAYPLVQEVNEYLIHHPEYGSALPRKFKIAITGCRDDCILAGINDLAFTPARRSGQLGFNVWAGGGLSDYPRLASDLGLFVTPEQVLETVKATVAVYKEFGDYDSKAVNRFRRLVDEMGPNIVRQEMAKRAPFPFSPAGEDLTETPRYDHLGVHPQKQPGYFYVGLGVPVGRMMGEELVRIADLALTYGDGNVRLTQRQNLVITGVPEGRLDALLKEPILQKFSPNPPTFMRSVVACTSAPFCKFGIFNMKERGPQLAQLLDAVLGDYDFGPIRLHLSGCKASCAQIQIADIGLRATLTKDEEAYQEAFDVAIGGNLGEGRLAEWIELEVPLPQVYAGVKHLLSTYKDQRSDGETFSHFLQRLDRTTVRSFFREAVS